MFDEMNRRQLQIMNESLDWFIDDRRELKDMLPAQDREGHENYRSTIAVARSMRSEVSEAMLILNSAGQ